MMSLAQRVRDFRYSKGWGPDELANRAEISRTALYQIESGKTGLPRAGTLRRIAVALDVSMDELLGHPESNGNATSRAAREHHAAASRSRDLSDWIPSEGSALTLNSHHAHAVNGGNSGTLGLLDDARVDESRFAIESSRRSLPLGFDPLLLREGELMSKLHDLLHSSMGSGIARIIDDLHQMVHRNRTLS